MTPKQRQVLDWLMEQRKGSNSWFRPSQMQIPNFPGGAQGAGRASKALFQAGELEQQPVYRGNGSNCTAYRAKRSAPA